MNFTKRLATYLLCLLIAVLPACAGYRMNDEQSEAARATIQSEYRAGRITRAQRNTAIEMLDNQGPIDWDKWIGIGSTVLTSLVLGVPISVGAVHAVRGRPSPTELAARKAAAASRKGA